ncbi:MAG TPA: hypothetical protein VN715_06650 [Roseiarcus sp.]|nr:hypothetical protein [Roseiarcus sp.]
MAPKEEVFTRGRRQPRRKQGPGVGRRLRDIRPTHAAKDFRGAFVRSRDDQPRRLQAGEAFGEAARMVVRVHQSIGFPLHVVEFGNHIAGDRGFPSQRLDLRFAVEIAEDRGEAEAVNTLAQPDNVAPKPGSGATVADGALQVKLPPHSYQTIRLTLTKT